MTGSTKHENIPNAESRKSDIRVITRADDIMNAIAESPSGLSLSKISELTDIYRSSVHRIVVALCNKGYLRATDSGYQLGPALLRLANLESSQFETRIRPYLVKLSKTLNETVDLSHFTGESITVIDQVVALRRLRAVSDIGATFPLHAIAPGKAILAALAPSKVKGLLPPELKKYTSSTITNFSDLERELKKIRKSGIAFDREEFSEGVCAIGMAFKGPAGAWLAVSIPLPAQRFYGNEEQLALALSDAIQEIGKTISENFSVEWP